MGSRRRRRRRRRWAAAAAAAEIPTAPRPGSAHPLRGLRSLPDGGPQRLRDRGAGLARRVGEQVVLRRGARDAAAGLALALALALAGCELLGLPQLVRQRRKRRLSQRRDRREADGPTRVRGGPAGVRAGRGDWGAAEDGQRGEASEDGVPSDLVRKEKLGEKERNKKYLKRTSERERKSCAAIALVKQNKRNIEPNKAGEGAEKEKREAIRSEGGKRKRKTRRLCLFSLSIFQSPRLFERQALLQCAVSASRLFFDLAADATSLCRQRLSAARGRSLSVECKSTTTTTSVDSLCGSGKEERVWRSRGQACARRSEKGNRECRERELAEL